MHAPGILRVSSVEGCRNAIAKVESGEAKPIEQDIIRYLSCFDEVSFKGSLSSPGELGTPSNAEIQWKGMLGAISDELSN
jgi:hypothetical protein